MTDPGRCEKCNHLLVMHVPSAYLDLARCEEPLAGDFTMCKCTIQIKRPGPRTFRRPGEKKVEA